MDIVASYGHNGPHGDGADVHVADLLQRTIEGQWKTTQTYASSLASWGFNGPAVLHAELPTTTVLYAQRLAMTRWMMATAFLDGVVLTHREAPILPPDVYATADALCDHARRLTRQAVEMATQQKGGNKVRLLGIDMLDDLVFSARNLRGVWAVFEVILAVTQQELQYWEGKPIPVRFKQLMERELQRTHSHMESFRYLGSDWRSTRLDENRVGIVKEAVVHIKALYEILQRLWAPYLLGNEYTTALKRKPTLSELSVKDPWVLTDPILRLAKKGNVAAEEELAGIWDALRDPLSVEQLATQVQQLVKSRHIRRRTGRGYGIAPWPSQFMVRHSFVIGESKFAVGDLAAFYVTHSADGRSDVTLRRTGRLTRILDLFGLG